MNASLVGVDHRTAPVAIREKAAIRAEQLQDSMLLLRSHISQGVILSTCNRTEVYAITDDGSHAEEASLNFLKARLHISDAPLPRYMYALRGDVAVEHLFRTASGLDSMIVGEYEVLGQVKQALEVAEKAKMVSFPLRHIFQSAIQTGRRVRRETGISKNAVSVGSVAVDLAIAALGDLENCKMLIIGAGEVGCQVAKAARYRGVSQIIIASRTQERASALTSTLGGIPVRMDSVAEQLKTCNLVVTCADAPHWILDVYRMEVAMGIRPELPLVVIDIAVPRNVDPAVQQIRNVFLYNIDDLTQISERNRTQREGETQKAAEIIAADLAEFTSWWRSLEVRPVVSALMSMSENIRCAQLNKTLKDLRPLSNEERSNLVAMTKSIVTKILQEPINCLKANVNGNSDYAKTVRELFKLEIDK